MLGICNPVGASLLAMEVNDDEGCLNKRGVLRFFASKLVPTGASMLGATRQLRLHCRSAKGA
ncbi:hypothetical protein EMIT0P218_130082 [Pseudomonas sp. IT-P218]